ncbi:uncharacterized protein LOC135491088 [Lineus longissimus]|uniref:uncharacterized protein LOC135491088 n=1 Tax=Lineus longissimus TaxID=88925 RepID=UPI00315CEA6C
MTVLQYIKNESKRFHTYVANRIADIRDATSPNQWRHCPGVSNPSDFASRGLSPQKLASQDGWWNGPEFLWQDEDQWLNSEVQPLAESDPEVRKGSQQVCQVSTRVKDTEMVAPEQHGLSRVIYYYGSWKFLLRMVAWLLRFCQWIKDKKHVTVQGGLSVEEIQGAARVVSRIVQAETFAEEIATIQAGDEIKEGSKLTNLRPIVVDGLLRVGGRLERAVILSWDEKHPIILPRDHPVTVRVMRHYHEKLAHAGREQTLAESRLEFWVIRGKGLAKSIVRNCIKYRIANGRVMEQLMGQLPPCRLVPYQPPFTFTGVDFFGPMQLKWGLNKTKKCWGCLFTCLNSRAVYLEVAPSLSMDDFIMVLRQFICHRGPPEEIRSDHGSNFVGANRKLQESVAEWNHEKIQKELQQKGVKWEFHPPTAAHMSGVWERLVQSTKRHLRVLAEDRLLTEFQIRTLFAEVEAILNNRPLCAVSEDINDLEALTPNHLLLQRKVAGLPPGVFTKEDGLRRKEWRKIQYLSEQFWKRWMSEYLPSLQQRSKWLTPRRNIQEGDLVMMKDDGILRIALFIVYFIRLME